MLIISRFFVIGGKFLNIVYVRLILCKSSKNTRKHKQKPCYDTEKCTKWQKNDIFSGKMFAELEKCCNFACNSLETPM